MPKDFVPVPLSELKTFTNGEFYDDEFSKGRYSTDASIYQIQPLAVFIPKSKDDVIKAVNFCLNNNISILPRGGGTSQCGQTVNRSLVIDNSKYFNKIIDFDEKNKTCTVEPGIVLDELNKFLKPFGLWFPVDVSTSSRATIGGMAGNNSCGGRSLKYGMMRDNVLSIEAILNDGKEYCFGDIDIDELRINLEDMITKYVDGKYKFDLNPSGSFVKGGPAGDTGLTGRKIVVDAYGPTVPVGGGAFSGKDPSKVDRSAAYAARHLAKNIVAHNLADKCQIRVAYAIGKAEPYELSVDTFGSQKEKDSVVNDFVSKFGMKPGVIIERLDLLNVNYREDTLFSHFGHENRNWEKIEDI